MNFSQAHQQLCQSSSTGLSAAWARAAAEDARKASHPTPKTDSRWAALGQLLALLLATGLIAPLD